jgi:hypothetical protein
VTAVQIIEELRRDGIKVVEKKGWFWKTLHWLVAIVTFGQNRDFLRGYYTTIGPVIGLPNGMKPAAANPATLMHEAEHVQQFRSLGWGNAWVGIPLMLLLYIFLPLPIGLAWFRYYFEREAYAVGIEWELLNARGYLQTGKIELRQRRIAQAVEQLTGPMYGWTWPFKKSVARWFEQRVIKIYLVPQKKVDA